MRQPLPKVSIFRDLVIDHERIHAGLAHHQRLLNFPVVVQRENTILVGVEFANEALVQGVAHKPAEINNAKPGLSIEYQCMDETIVAREPRGFEMLVHFEFSTRGDNTAS